MNPKAAILSSSANSSILFSFKNEDKGTITLDENVLIVRFRSPPKTSRIS